MIWATLDEVHLSGFLLTVPAGEFLLRRFLAQQQCGHGFFFRKWVANDWTGHLIGVLNFTAYDYAFLCRALHYAEWTQSFAVCQRFSINRLGIVLGLPRVTEMARIPGCEKRSIIFR